MEFVVIARYRALAGEAGRVETALRNMREPSRAEPGNLDYRVHRDPAEPGVFVLYERYADESAFQRHLATEHFATWIRDQVLPSLAERVRYDLTPID